MKASSETDEGSKGDNDRKVGSSQTRMNLQWHRYSFHSLTVRPCLES